MRQRDSRRSSLRRPARATVLLLAATLLLAAAAAGSPEPGAHAATPPAPTEAALEAETEALAATLRCQSCANQSVAASRAPLARQMRAHIRRELAAGRAPDAIRAELVARYGAAIRLKPPVTGGTLALWLAPGVLLLAGLGLASLAFRGRPGPATARARTNAEAAE